MLPQVTPCESASSGATMARLFSLQRLPTHPLLRPVGHPGDVGQLDNTVNLLQNQLQGRRRGLLG